MQGDTSVSSETHLFPFRNISSTRGGWCAKIAAVMEIFLDTADPAQIERGMESGLVDGVTTNPSHVAATGQPAQALYRRIVAMVPGPVSLETVGLEASAIVEEGKVLADYGPNVVVKVPVIPEGLKAVRKLAELGIKTNVTLNFSAAQALLAAKAGASYISPFIGRLDNAGERGMALVEDIRTIYDNYGFGTKILAAACRHVHHVVEAALAGAECCTLSYGIFDQLLKHPQTDEGLEVFLNDWKKVPQ